MLDDARVDDGNLVYLPVQDPLDFDQLVEQSARVDSIYSSCSSPSVDLLGEHCRDGIANEVLRHPSAADLMLLA